MMLLLLPISTELTRQHLGHVVNLVSLDHHLPASFLARHGGHRRAAGHADLHLMGQLVWVDPIQLQVVDQCHLPMR